MISVRKLFTFTRQEVASTFEIAQAKKYGHGLKLLGAPCPEGLSHGKLLIVTPRACGKAHDRNLIRRRLKEIFYTEKLYTKRVTWILLIRKQAIELTFDQLKEFLITATK